MHIIRGGFTTKKDVIKQFADNGVEIKLGFSATNLKTKKNPFKNCKLKDKYGNEQIITQL